jgi:signal transduction histidine kinase
MGNIEPWDMPHLFIAVIHFTFKEPKMKNLTISALCLFTATGFSATVQAQARSTAAEAIALVDAAITYMNANGLENSITEFNNLASPFNSVSALNKNGDLYLFMFHANKGGVQIVHGKNPKLPGRDVIDMRDADGTYLIREIIKMCNQPSGKGWVNYKWPNPVTKNIEEKQSYIVKYKDICIGTGIYRQ